MPTNLVIVESPAKAKTIERFLGKDFKVLSSKGHIRDLKKKNFGVDLDTFEPQYEIPSDKRATVAQLRSEAQKADAVWLASDEDREGEAISWHLAEVLNLDPHTARRIVFHEITKPAIEYAIEHPRTINLNLVDAQQARRVLDRLVGFKISPILWRKVRPNLSAGRVQSVAVRLVVEREREISAFKPESAYKVTAEFMLPDKQTFTATYSQRFASAAEVEAFLEKAKTLEFSIAEVSQKPTKRVPAPPFTTSTLQQEAARKLGYSVSLTMRIAQALYEAGHITYMRTDSTNLSSLCIGTTGKLIEEQMGKPYHKVRQYHTNAKGAQEAHEAIRPTYIDHESIEGTAQERRLYELIWKRTVASQMADAKLEKTTATIKAKGLSGEFTAMGEVVLFDGFLKVYRESAAEETEETESRLLPHMQNGEKVDYTNIVAQERYSQPPTRYNEAALVHKLEELGIGRPSTYAPTISTIQQREYVVRGSNEGMETLFDVVTLQGGEISHSKRREMVGNDRGRLVPTDTGVVVNDFLMEYFPEIMDYNFTANVEKEFDQVAAGNTNWTEMIRHFYNEFDPQVEKTLHAKSEHHVGERILGTDPATGKTVSVRIGRFGPMVQIGNSAEDNNKPRFSTLKRTQSIQTITLEEALDLFKLPRSIGEYEEKEILINEGKFGPYIRHDGKFISIPKEEDPLGISLERAIELIEEKRQSDAAKHLKTFDEDAALQILQGRWGPYIVYKEKNYRIPNPKQSKIDELSYEDCMKIVESEDKKTPEQKAAAKAAARRAATGRAAAKKKK